MEQSVSIIVGDLQFQYSGILESALAHFGDIHYNKNDVFRGTNEEDMK